jgi:hypothetical protein
MIVLLCNMPNFNKRDFPPLPSMSKKQNDGDQAMGTRDPVIAGACTTINDLPAELLLEVLHYLPGIDLEHFQLASLLSLSCTSHNFHRLVAKQLNASYNSYFCEPYLFLRTVITNAAVAGHVQHADITYGTWSHHERKRYRANAQDKKAIKEGLKALGIPDWKKWATDCNTDFVELDTLHTAVLMHTPNIRSINITHGLIGNFSGTPTPRWIELFRRANSGSSLGNMHRFQNLRSISVDVDELTLSQLAPVFRTASLRKLHFKSMFEYDEAGTHAERLLQHAIPQRCSNLEEIHLEDSVLQIDILGVLIAAARSLRTFRYQMALNSVPATVQYNCITGSHTLATVLQSQRSSLESLFFTTDIDPEPNFPGTFNLHQGLRDFTALKYLSCAFGSIVDHSMNSLATPFENLTRSLTTLHLFLDDDEFVGDKDALTIMEHAAHEFATDLPLVRKLRLTVGAALSGKYDWTRLIMPFSQTEIDLVVDTEQEEDGWSENWQNGAGITGTVPSDVESESSGEESLYSATS